MSQLQPSQVGLALDEPMSPLQILFSFQGRVPRRTWWLWGVAALIGIAFLLTALLRIAGMASEPADLLVNALLLWPSIAVSVKRFHDRDKSGWWALLWVLPVIGWIWAIVENGFLRGSEGANRFGANMSDRF